MDLANSTMKRSKKPKPLFGIFRSKTHKQDNLSLGSGTGPVPLQSVLSPTPKPSISETKHPLFSPQFPPKQIRRPRSRSVGPASSRMLNEREMALNKLCQNDNSPQSLDDSLALLSPPPVPPIPTKHQVRKFSSAHDLRKAAKANLPPPPPIPPVPKISTSIQDLSRSRSLNSSRLKPSKSYQQLKCPKTATAATFPRRLHDDDDDDDIPLGYLQSPISKPSSLLSDKDDDDDIDLVPIAKLACQEVNAIHEEYMTAADKYKEKVIERLQLEVDDGDDDDDIPISLSLSKKLNNKRLIL
ncbi:hypothetical protein BY458DRAFT_515366 [Sporodiniella umbellata]|nr:hypothetical protein BY458DRAFT_515366 [Sporodiniella umbellata]